MDLENLKLYVQNSGLDQTRLYRGLGTFWTLIFQEKETLKGYTLALVEEKIQQYLSLIATINKYSIKEIPVFDPVRWKPILIYKSKYNQTPFVFEPNSSTFGPQPDSASYYVDIVFRFGYNRTPNNNVYVYTLPEAITHTGVICDRILDPTMILHSGLDIKFEGEALYFNSNIFDNPNLPRIKIVGENGIPETYIDSNGVTQEEELIVLWAYNAQLSANQLYYNFGYLFKLNIDNSEYTKNILSALFATYVDGPTVKNIKTCCAMFMGVPVVLNSTEVVEEMFSDTKYNYVVTDKECYKVSNTYTLSPNIVLGAQLNIGDTLVTNIQFYDNLTRFPAANYGESKFSTGWWNSQELVGTGLAFSKYLFNGAYMNQLTFSSELSVITLDANDHIVFPVEGSVEDVRTFHNYINDASRKETIKSKLALVYPGDSYATVPLTFVMENFLKTNSAILYINFYAEQDKTKFLSLLKLIKEQLPKYVYLIIKLNITFPADTYANLNDAVTLTFDSGDQLLNADGSNQDGELAKLAPYYYKDISSRLFELARGVKKDPANELDMDYVVTTTAGLASEIITDGRVLVVKEGTPLRPIPTNATTAQYNNLLLLAFS